MIDLREEMEDIRITLEKLPYDLHSINVYENNIINMITIAVNVDIPGLLDRIYSGARVGIEEVVKYRNLFLESIEISQGRSDIRKEIHNISFDVDEMYRKILEMV